MEVAAKLLGSRLRQIFPIRHQYLEDGHGLELHNDWGLRQADLHGQVVNFRDTDEDYIFQRCEQPASAGGESFVVDGYLLIDRIQRECPDLYRFLTAVDIDFRGAWANPQWGTPPTPLLRRLVEYTRGGRRVVRVTDIAAPVPNQPDAEQHQAMLARYLEIRTAATTAAPRFSLEPGDILALDNYRFLHGREPFDGPRKLQVLTTLSSDSWAGIGW